MKKALRLARYGMFTTGANPRVGCLLVKDDQIIAEAYHQRVGEPHAEAMALQQAGHLAQGSTAYVTLEPCSHVGKNPPCADALIAAGVAHVVVCNDDPNPLVSGQGYAKLSAAGISYERGVLSARGERLNQGFLHRMRTGLPWVRSKSAQSLDGRTAMANGNSHWITGEQARADVQYWRGRSGAVITGIETVLNDDCRLNFRPKQLAPRHARWAADVEVNQPLRVVVDSQLRMPADARILREPSSVMVATCSNDQARINRLLQAGIDVQQFPSVAGRVDLPALLKHLAERHINEVLVEAGARLSGAFLQQGLLDELIIFTAPVLMGATARPLFEINVEEMAQRHHIDILSIKKFGKDIRVIARPNL